MARFSLHGKLVVLSWLLLVASSSAYANCPEQPPTQYERIYCEIKSKGGGAALPSFEDFRRNDPNVQALLLKRPASSLGIDLPASTQPTPEVPSSDSKPQRPKPAAEPPKPESIPVAGALGECGLQGATIQCLGQSYQLAKNRPNSALKDGVLDESNKLGLESFAGDLSNETTVRTYLSNAYDRYIAKMLEIGLGGATMSFTRFYNSFYRHEAEGVDFAERMESTFSYLKQDKRNLAVSGRLTDELPKRIQECAWAGHSLIVCDNVATNWVYVRAD